MNIKYGPIFADQSKREKTITETKKDTSEEQNENCANQLQTNRTFENKNSVNKDQRKHKSVQSEISTLESSCSTKEIKSSNQIPKTQKLNTKITEMDRENFYQWGATREIMEIIRRPYNSPETRRLIDQRNELSRTGTLRR